MKVLVGLTCAWLLAPVPAVLALRFVEPRPTAFMLVARLHGQPAISSLWVDSARLPERLRRGLIAAEDLRFCRHGGFDLAALRTQIAVWRAGGRPTGASTLTMQLARNLFLWPARGVVRKGLEAWLTPYVALLWPRRRQIEVYLNVAEFGPHVFGAQAGATYWFGTDLTALDAGQLALLLGILPAPERSNPAHPGATLQARADAIRTLVDADDPRLDCAR